MRTPSLPPPIALVLATLLAAVWAAPALAQNDAPAGSGTSPTSGSDRSFLSFFQEATLVDQQWWEGQLEFQDGNEPFRVDTMLLRAVLALRVHEKIEVGGQVGFGTTDSDVGPDGTGATDLDAYFKWHFGEVARNTELASGAILTIPTGDNTAGLGIDAFALGGFVSVRHKRPRWILNGVLDLTANGDASFRGSRDVDGSFSGRLGFGAIFPMSEAVSYVGEIDYEGKRFEGGKATSVISNAINWRIFSRGMLRFALGFGLSDGSPDAQFTASYAYHF